jgi:urease accessory protein
MCAHSCPYEAGAPADGWQAQLSLGYARRTERTVLIDRRHVGPLHVQKALYPEGFAACHTIIVHPPGGIVGGDRLRVRLTLGEESHVVITGPSATKWYRANGRPATQGVSASVARGALLEWLPQEAIFYDGAQAELATAVMLADGAAFFGWEILCLGRTAAGEAFTHGRLKLTTEVYLAGRPLLVEKGDLTGGSAILSSPVGLAGSSVFAAVLAAGKPIDPDLLADCRAFSARFDEHCGVSALGPLLVARYLGDSSEQAKAYCIGVWTLVRPFLAGRPARIPRIWNT